MSKEISKELDRLERVIDQALNINIDELSFIEELAIIRIIEEVGGIAKAIERYGINLEELNIEWKYAIRTRDKISHSYESLTIEPLLEALKDLEILKKDIPTIKKQIK